MCTANTRQPSLSCTKQILHQLYSASVNCFSIIPPIHPGVVSPFWWKAKQNITEISKYGPQHNSKIAMGKMNKNAINKNINHSL